MTAHEQFQHAARRATIKWTAIIVGLLTMQVSLCAWGVYCATSGRGMAIESDYYNKALHWDEYAALQRKSAELGWKAQVDVGTVASTIGERALTLTLTDRDGYAIDHAEIRIAFFHHARPMELQTVDVKETAPGQYAASTRLNHQGIWEFRVTIHREKETFIATIQKDLAL